MSRRPEVVVDGLRFPEGPLWCADGTIVCTSVAEGALYRVWPGEGRKERIAEVGGGANAAAPADDGGFLVTQNGGIDFGGIGLYEDPPPYRPATPGVQRVSGDGSVSYLLEGGFLAPNDLVVAADGTLYFTDPPHHPPPAEPMGRVHAFANGQLRTLADGFEYCNGIALDPAGTVMVVEANGLMRVEADGSKEWVCQLPGAAGDGFCFDMDGNFYVATASDHGILIVDPHGAAVEFLPIGDADTGGGIVTNCCFGGEDGRTLFATDGIPGQLVAWEGLPVPGREIYPWRTASA
jgi:gluconolactonase